MINASTSFGFTNNNTIVLFLILCLDSFLQTSLNGFINILGQKFFLSLSLHLRCLIANQSIDRWDQYSSIMKSGQCQPEIRLNWPLFIQLVSQRTSSSFNSIYHKKWCSLWSKGKPIRKLIKLLQVSIRIFQNKTNYVISSSHACSNTSVITRRHALGGGLLSQTKSDPLNMIIFDFRSSLSLALVISTFVLEILYFVINFIFPRDEDVKNRGIFIDFHLIRFTLSLDTCSYFGRE